MAKTQQVICLLLLVFILLLGAAVVAYSQGNTGNTGISGIIGGATPVATSTVTPTPTPTPTLTPTPWALQPGTTGLDTYIGRSSSSNNYGINAAIKVGDTSVASYPYRGLLQFDLSSVPVTYSITSALLQLYVASEQSTADYAIGLHRGLVQWYEGAQSGDTPDIGEDASTWSDRNYNGPITWTGGAGGLAGTEWVVTPTDQITITGVGPVTYNVTSDIQAWLAITTSNYGWWLIGSEETTTDTFKNFLSSDYATYPDRRPKLIMTTTIALNSPAYFVATTGSDATGTGAITNPWRTIGKAAGEVAPGYTVYIRGGVYSETIDLDTSGTVTDPIIFTSYPAETATVDTAFARPATERGLINVDGDYVEVRNLEIGRSKYSGLWLNGAHDTAHAIYAHENRYVGIQMAGDDNIVEDSYVWRNSLRNEFGGSEDLQNSACLTASRYPNRAIIRRNRVWECWGEALSTYESYGTLIEDNLVYNNWLNLYISDAADVIVRRNLIYNDISNTYMYSGTQAASGGYYRGANTGILIGSEGHTPALNNVQIYNNIVYGTNRTLYAGSNITNLFIGYNTLAEAWAGAQGNVRINSTGHSGTLIENNVISQSGSIPLVYPTTNCSGTTALSVTFTYNNWSALPPACARGTGDVNANPALVGTGGSPLAATYYHLSASSPGISHAVAITQTTEDYFGVTRDANPDQGAAEYIP